MHILQVDGSRWQRWDQGKLPSILPLIPNNNYLLFSSLYILCSRWPPKRVRAEAEVIQNRPFIRVGRYGHFRTEWTSQKDFIYSDSQTARFLIFLRKIAEKSIFFYMKCTIMVLLGLILRNRVESIFGYLARHIGKPIVSLCSNY